MSFRDWLTEKLNPAQPEIAMAEGEQLGSSNTTISSALTAYEKIPVVRRGVDLIVDSCAGIQIDVGQRLKRVAPHLSGKVPTSKRLPVLLNSEPNPYISGSDFKSNVFMDLVIEGNAFIYWDGAFLYNIPAVDVEIFTDKKAFISKYEYNNIVFKPEEIIHIRENSARSIYRGDSRLRASMDSINVLSSMVTYQKTFFDNSAIPGLILKSPNILSKKIKDRIMQNWRAEYNPRSGGRRPLILDGDLELKTLNDSSFKELDFSTSIEDHEGRILEALGVPPVLLSSGNNANITPNLKLFYLSTVLPLFTKYVSALERFFGYDLKENKQDIEALRPELADQANFLTSLTNAGILTRNESRDKIRMPKSDSEVADELILPANIAGSASNSGVGGRPEENKEE